jgi:hypothetical protein
MTRKRDERDRAEITEVAASTIDTDRSAAQNPQAHLTGEKQAAENAESESPG